MAPRTEEQFEEIRESKKQLIMDTALELFASEGYYPTSINKIAKKAGISKGLMYNYFESKEALIKEIIFKGIDDIFKSFDPDHDGVLTSEEFRFYIIETFKLIKSNTEFWKLFISTIIQPTVYEMIKDKIAHLSPDLMNPLTGYFQNRFGDHFQTEMFMFVSTIKGAIMQYIYTPEMFPVEEIKQKLIDTYA